ncbi:MAG: hypothetical protein LBD23_15800, partial [Oscillospiraceae bacterium]|nr:hypothetical protein [Oscillospiraceae bacterium]
YFTVSNPGGDIATNHKILAGLKNLRTFLESFVYINMTRDTSTVQGSSIASSYSMISQKGRQYAMYMHHSFTNGGGYLGTYYEPAYGEYEPMITLALDKGLYSVEFIDPESMNLINTLILQR